MAASDNINRIVKEATKKSKNKVHEVGIEKSYGNEPTWESVKNTDANFSSRVGQAFNWATGVLELEQLKQETLDYLISQDRSIESFKDLKPVKFYDSGKLAWLFNKGCPLTDKMKVQLETRISTILILNPNEVELDENGQIITVEEKPKRSKFETRQRNLDIRTSELAGYIQDLIDESIINRTEINSSVVYKKLAKDEIDERTAKAIYDFFGIKHKNLIAELQSLENLSPEENIRQFDDDDCLIRYIEDIQNNIDEYVSVLNQIASFLGNKKAIKKSERKADSKFTAKRVEVQANKLNFKVQDSEYKIISISPTSIIGSMVLVTLNTATRKLSIYKALDENGLSIKGTTIQNFNEETSVQKILKKPDLLGKIQQGNINRLNILFKDIKAKESTISGRTNNDVILLKVFKDKYPDK